MGRPLYRTFCGAGAALGALAGIALRAKAEGRPVAAPVNASGHWLWRDAEAARPEAEPVRTGVGLATNVAAGVFWGTLLGSHLHRRPRRPAEILRGGVALGAAAGLLDYGILPRRLSPGWELALSGRSVALIMASMAGGAAAGGLAARRAARPTR